MPLPASGRTAERWQRLASLAESDIVAARIPESHVDALAKLDEPGGEPPYRSAASTSADAYTLAHLGAVDAALAAGDAMLATAAAHIDCDPFDRSGTAQLLARRTRTVIEHAADEAITRTGRALGPGPLC